MSSLLPPIEQIASADILTGIEQAFLLELHGALKERDEALLHSRQSLRLADKVFESTLEGILITDGDSTILSVNPAFSRITGYASDEAVGQTPALLKSGKQGPDFYRQLWDGLKRDGQWQGEVVNRRKNGLLYTEHLSITAIRDEAEVLSHYVAVFSDITQRKQAEERLHFLANHDALTGLPNRTLFLESLAEAIAWAERRRWVDAGLFAGRMAVNLSGRQLKLGGLVDTVRASLAEAGLASAYLELEVTESVAMDDADGGQVGMLCELRALGVQLAIDDFGTGYSSLAYLKRLPVQVLKIDRSFIADLSHDRDDAAITTAIVSIAKSLGLAVVAEGVEEPAQRDFLAGLGCDAAQGYLFGRPVPEAEFEAYLAAHAG
ncbi:sensor domain-containing protein [Crenobacter cavernae]|uniref:EAL domain-containing protein n=1 Tax=Crenobacter cavernae TaxID=2290923 RepID=A0ABY0FDA9_9NEIS|nr:EAL domain-containing protein [Crenobacter cavernae]RXZ44178.1 EAL domain-containing protein [Crenobacter cavernae]